MGRPITFSEAEAFRLYHELKSDHEIAKELGVSLYTIRGWRQRKKLPNICKPKIAMREKKAEPITNPRSYRDILSKEQADEMGRFLYSLLWASEKAKECGVKPDVETFMKSWIGKPVSEGGRREERRAYGREYGQRMKEKSKRGVS